MDGGSGGGNKVSRAPKHLIAVGFALWARRERRCRPAGWCKCMGGQAGGDERRSQEGASFWTVWSSPFAGQGTEEALRVSVLCRAGFLPSPLACPQRVAQLIAFCEGWEGGKGIADNE